MIYMVWMVLGLLFSVVSFFPLVNSPHWMFRVFDFIRLQLLVVLLALLGIGLAFWSSLTPYGLLTVILIISSVVYHLFVVAPYLPKKSKNGKVSGQSVVVLSVNVMQENEAYENLVALVKRVRPDILLTMETDKKWEHHLAEIEPWFKGVVRVPKDNRYGMHLYTTLELQHFDVHYLISEEHPSIEARLKDHNNIEFVFWGIHPPPPSPTEKPTAKQKDAELMKLAQLVRKSSMPTVVMGDFNNVAWSKISKVFSKTSHLRDARINKGIHGTFPAKFWPLRFPIDLLFHSSVVTVTELKVLPPIGSDHLPFLSELQVHSKKEPKKEPVGEAKNFVEHKIKEGEQAAKKEN